MLQRIPLLSALLSMAALCTVTLFGGCGGASSDADEAGRWTVTDDRLALEEDLFVTDNDDFYFGRIIDMALSEDGRIYVSDGEAHHIKVLSLGGTLLDTIGIRGEGPGEFELPAEIVLARGDSIYVLDGRRGRVSIFSPDHRFEYSFMARAELASPGYMMVPDRGKGFWFAFSPYPRMTIANGDVATIRTVTANGVIGDTLFTARPYQIVWEGDPNGRMTFYYAPFLRRSYYALGPDERIHHAWSDSLRVTTYNGAGGRLRTVNIPFEAVPVTESDLDYALEGRDANSRAVVEEQLPDTKPAFDRFLVDDRGRYWFKRPTANPDSVDWWIADPAMRNVDVVPLPSTVDVMIVRDGYAYGRSESEGGAPALVRYRIVEG